LSTYQQRKKRFERKAFDPIPTPFPCPEKGGGSVDGTGKKGGVASGHGVQKPYKNTAPIFELPQIVRTVQKTPLW